MADQLHPTATLHLPGFVTAPGETDVLMVVMAVFLGLSVFGFGILFLHLHTLPERVAHKGQKIQFELVAILGLLALFTHIHIFWVAGLLLAFIDLPDFGGFMGRIATSVERIAGIEMPEPGAPTLLPVAEAAFDQRGSDEPSKAKSAIRTVASRKERDHA